MLFTLLCQQEVCLCLFNACPGWTSHYSAVRSIYHKALLMKRHVLLCTAALLLASRSQAQFTAGTEGLNIKPNTDVALDGLTFNADAAFSLVSNKLTVSSVALPGSPGSINRVYEFSSPFSFTGRTGLYYRISELNGNTENLLQVVYLNSSTVVASSSVVDVSSHYIYNDLSSAVMIKRVTAAQQNSLPVTLIGFTAQKEGALSHLEWSTSYETNSDFFEVQRSIDGHSWLSLGKVPAGFESKSVRHYEYTDRYPGNGTNFYRLKMVDQDGTFGYSRIQDVFFNILSGTVLYPNPVVESFKVKVDNWSEIASIELFNASGQSLLESRKPMVDLEINMKDFPSGIYLLRATRTTGTVDAIKVIKE